MPRRRRTAATPVAALLASLLLLAGCGDDADEGEQTDADRHPSLPDLSGLAWLGGDRFLAVHDAKNPDEKDLNRLSLLQLPDSLAGIDATELDVEWPEPQGESNDLESADRVPGRNMVVFAESGDDGGDFQRIFLGEYDDDSVEIVSSLDWPKPVENVEGIAVGQVGKQLAFLYAERAQGEPRTEIAWAPLEVDPLKLGKFRSVPYTSPEPKGTNARPVTGLTVDSKGAIYAVSAFDPDVDDGPFTSYIWRAGELQAGAGGRPVVTVEDEPELLGTLDGFKGESVVVREAGKRPVVFAGTDDEFYGGALRPLPE